MENINKNSLLYEKDDFYSIIREKLISKIPTTFCMVLKNYSRFLELIDPIKNNIEFKNKVFVLFLGIDPGFDKNSFILENSYINLREHYLQGKLKIIHDNVLLDSEKIFWNNNNEKGYFIDYYGDNRYYSYSDSMDKIYETNLNCMKLYFKNGKIVL